jgi:hypothetical protein
LNNKKVSTKSNAIFLAIVLLAGTFAAIFPSFIIKGVNAQAGLEYYYGMDKRYSSYEQEPEYQPEYPSYGKDKLKKDSSSKKSVSINKLNCINNNVNINGNNTGDINVGNSGSSATGPGTDEGYLGDYSSGSGYDGEGYSGYDNGYKKQKDESFSCIINNNNINNNFRAGNATDDNLTEPLTCEECFTEFLTPTELATINPVSSCQNIANGIVTETELRNFLTSRGVDNARINLIIECILKAGLVFEPEGFNAQGGGGNLHN